MSISRSAPLVRALIAGAATVSALLVSASPALAASSPSTQRVGFQGTFVTVPQSWPVFDLSADPTTCVRFDVHAVYLGSPGADQDCPANVLGHTEAVLVEPAPAGAASTDVVEHAVSDQFDRVAAGVQIVASYDTDRATALAIMTSATPAPKSPSRLMTQPDLVAPMTATVPASATNDTGKGFDPCTAPAASTMNAWLASPYRAIGIYIGGENRSCSQPNLTASWVASQAAAGWHFFPLYVGKQAPSSGCTKCSTIVSAASDGKAEADEAVSEAAALGFGDGTPINFDMENYPSSSTTTVLTFLSAWSSELHADGYASGVYSSSSSGIEDLATHYTSYTMPDVIDTANWNGDVDTNDSNVPSNEWANHQRIHQYSGGHDETYGGLKINIDSDYLDVNLSSVSGTASVYGINANGTLTYSTIDAATGNFGGIVTSTTPLAFTPKAMATLNFNTLLVTSTDGHLYRIDISTNNTNLVYYPPVDLGTGWGSFDMLAFDGNKHLYGIIKSTGFLRRYDINTTKPTATDITNYTTIGTGFGTIDTLTATGTDWLEATTSAGVLRSYHITGADDWTGATLADHGWDGPTVLMSPGAGVLYANSGTALYHYLDLNPYDSDGTDIQYFLNDPVTASGWTQTLLSTQPNTIH